MAEIYVAYCGGIVDCNGYVEPKKDNVYGVLYNGDSIIQGAKNPTDADAYIYEIKDRVKTLHVFESPCKPYMTCTYNGSGLNKIISNQDNIWQKIVIDNNSAQTRVMSSYYEFTDDNRDYRIGKYGQGDVYQGFIDTPITVKFYFVNSGDTEYERESGDMVSHTNEGMFSGCISLVSCNVPCQMRIISKGTFSGCTSLTSYTENPNFVETIGEYAFADCTSLPEAVIGKPTKISKASFMNCSSITSITWNFQVTDYACMAEIPESAFTNCTNLTSTDFLGNEFGRVIIPTGIKDIKDCAFSGCTRIERLEFKSVSAITNQAFENCINISAISGFSGTNVVKSVGDRAFYSAGTNNQNVITGFGDLSQLNAIGASAFSYVKFDSNLTINCNIQDYSFYNSAGGSVTFGTSVTNIGDYAFSGYAFAGQDDKFHITGNGQITRSANSFNNGAEVMLDDYAGTSLSGFCNGYYTANNWESCVFFNNAGQVIQ